MEKYLLIFLAAVFSLLGVSCGNTGIYVDVIQGNYSFSRGEYQEANLLYLDAEKTGLYREYLSYNLGNVYYALGEIDSALEEWDSIEEDVKPEIIIRTMFNKGVLLFELSRYEEAYSTFRKVLEIDPANIDAKINLEFSIQKMNFNTENNTGPAKSENEEDLRENDDVRRVLDFVRRRETSVWNSEREDQTEKINPRDW